MVSARLGVGNDQVTVEWAFFLIIERCVNDIPLFPELVVRLATESFLINYDSIKGRW